MEQLAQIKKFMQNNKKRSIVVLISGNGSNLQAIIDKIKTGALNAEIKAVISNKIGAFGLERAKKAGILTEVFNFKKFQKNKINEKETTRKQYCAALAKIVKKYNPDLVVLAGWMLILTNEFLHEFPMRVINLHPALLPAFPGTEGIKQAIDYGAKITGVTVHFVPDEGVDTGPIILQEAVRIEEDDTLESLEVKIHAIEHKLLPEAVRLFLENKLKMDGRKIRFNAN